MLKFTLLFFVVFLCFSLHIDGGSVKMAGKNKNGNSNFVQVKNSAKKEACEQKIELECTMPTPTNWTVTPCDPPVENCQLFTYPATGYSFRQMDSFCCVADPTSKLNIRVIQANTFIEYDYVGITDVVDVKTYRFDIGNLLPVDVQTSHIVCVVFSSDRARNDQVDLAAQVQISLA